MLPLRPEQLQSVEENFLAELLQGEISGVSDIFKPGGWNQLDDAVKQRWVNAARKAIAYVRELDK